jgi:ABC-type transporter Mla maintaining outer membrane lipid asymmetry ATPase subunit MlaF
MSTLLQARGVTHSVDDRPLFDDLEFTVSVGGRIGLGFGHTGCGKSTPRLPVRLVRRTAVRSQCARIDHWAVEQFYPRPQPKGMSSIA